MSDPSRPSRLKKTGVQLDAIDLEAGRAAAVRAREDGDYESTLGAGGGRGGALKILIPLGALLALGIGVVVFMSVRPRGEDGGRAVGAAGAGGGGRVTEELLVDARSDEEVARAFLGAASWEERREHVRDAERILGQLAGYPEEVKTFPIAVAELLPMGVVMPDGVVSYARFSVRMPSGGRRFLCVVQTAEGGRVDYEAFARHGTVSWAQLLSGMDAREVRVMAEKDHYFNNLFRDDEKLVCFKLTSPDWPTTVWGYAPAESVTARLLSGIVARRPQRVTLALRSEQDSHLDSQFVISGVVINGWVRSPLDPEESLRMKLGE